MSRFPKALPIQLALLAVSARPTLSQVAPLIRSEEVDAFACDISDAPDLDGDGTEDLVIADPDPSMTDDARGGFWVVSGRTEKVIAHVEGPVGEGWFGVSVACLGKRAPGELVSFAVASVPAYPSNSVYGHRNRLGEGLVHIVQLDGSIHARIEDTSASSRFGVRVTSTPDLDGDCVSDVLVLDPGRYAHATRIYSGKSLKRLHEVGALAASGWFESNALVTSCAIRDVGRLLLCASDWDGFWLRRTVQVFRLDGGARRTIKVEGKPDEPWFGHAVAELPDLDADGWPEVAVGSPLNGSPWHRGVQRRVRILSSRTGVALRELWGAQDEKMFGAAIAFRGARVPEDAPRLLVTSAHWPGSGDRARLYEYSTRTWELVRTTELSHQGGQRLVVLSSASGADRIATSHCNCDLESSPGAVTILDAGRNTPPVVLTRNRLMGR